MENSNLINEENSARSREKYVVAWSAGKPVLRCVHDAGDGALFVAGIDERLVPYDGADGVPTSKTKAKALLESILYDGPCCPPFVSRAKSDQYIGCADRSHGHGCKRLAGCTASPRPPHMRITKRQWLTTKAADDVAATVRRLLRAAHVIGDMTMLERLTASGVYRLRVTYAPQPIVIQVQPGRVRLGIGGPWMPVPKRRATVDQRGALAAALVEGTKEEERARHAAKAALRKAYGRNYWQCYLLRFAESMRDQPRRRTLEDMIPRVDCELGFRYALCCARGWHPEGAAAELDAAVLEALRLVAP